MTDEERRRRLGLRHGLFEPFADCVSAAAGVVGLHSSDPATVYISAWARVGRFRVEDMASALYSEKTLVRILGMRRTMWVVPTRSAAAINSGSTAPMADYQFRRTAAMVESSGLTEDGGVWVNRVMDKTVEALSGVREALAADLTDMVPELGQKLRVLKKDGTLAGELGASTRILFLLSTKGLVVRTQPRGTWISSQYRWSTTENWLGAPLEPLDEQESGVSTLHDYLAGFGPATETDIRWWTGWNLGKVRACLARLGAIEVETEAGSGWMLEDDIPEIATGEPWVALLPGLDPATMGWKERAWYLGSTAPELFDRNGNAGPTIWADGRVVGGWAQRADGEIALEFLEDTGREVEESVETRAAELQKWMGDIRVTPRFRTPTERRLSS